MHPPSPQEFYAPDWKCWERGSDSAEEDKSATWVSEASFAICDTRLMIQLSNKWQWRKTENS